MSNQFVSTLAERAARGAVRALVVESIGPLTILAGFVWAVAQPYRIVFLHPEGKGFYDFLVQPPLLVIAVGLFFALAIAPALVDDLREEHGPTR